MGYRARFATIVRALTSERTEIWLARVLVGLATAWLAFCAAYGNLGVPAGGHLGGGMAANYMASEAMLKHHLWYPVQGWFTADPPPLATAYCHHPFGIYWIGVLNLVVFGARDWSLGIPSILMSAAMPVLIYRTFRDGLGRIPAAFGAVTFSLVPIEVGFAGFHNLEVAPMFGLMLFTAMGVRYLAKGGRGNFVLACLGALVAVCTCWIGYLYLALPLSGGLLTEFTWRKLRQRPRVHDRAVRLWVWSVAIAVGSLLFWVWAFHHLGKLGDWLAAMNQRSHGNERGNAAILANRREWLEFSFPPVFRWLAMLAAPLFVLRPLVRRRLEETVGLATLVGGWLWYTGFSQAADAHIFWPQPLALPIACGAVVLAATARDVLRFALGLVERVRPVVPYVLAAGTVLGVVFLARLVPDTARCLQEWKQTGGRFDEQGKWAFGEGDDADFALVRFARYDVNHGVQLHFHDSFGAGWWDLLWAAQKNPDKLSAPLLRGTEPQLLFTRASNLLPADLALLPATGHLLQVGDVIISDSRLPAGAAAYRVEHTPTLWESFLHGSYVPAYELPDAPDPFATWELQTHVGVAAAPPGRAPVTLDEQRIAYNVSVAAGAPSPALEAAILGALDRTAATRLGPLELVGVRRETGPSHEVELWVRTVEKLTGKEFLRIGATCTRRLPGSVVPRPERVLPVYFLPTFAAPAWRPGFLYVARSRPKHRVCVERIEAELVKPAEAPEDVPPTSPKVHVYTLR